MRSTTWATLLYLAASPLLAQTTFSNNNALTLPNPNWPGCTAPCTGGTTPPSGSDPYPSTISVSGLPGTLSTVKVRLKSLNARLADISVLLRAPGGQSFVLLAGRPSTGLSTSAVNGDFLFDDAASNLIPDASPVAPGTYKPTADQLVEFPVSFASPTTLISSVSFPAPYGTATLASTFNGLTPNGSWQLYVTDRLLGGSSGSLAGWDLILTTAVSNAPTTTTLTPSSASPLTTTNVTFTASVTSSGNPVTLGSVTFTDGATTLAANVALNASGRATFSSTLSEGSHLILASYSGATGFGSSNGSVNITADTPTTISGNVFCNPGALTLPKPPSTGASTGAPANPYPSRLFVSGLSGTISKVTLLLKGASLQYPDDLALLLQAPDTNRRLVVWSDAGGATPTANLNLTLDDSAAALLPDESALAAGSYRPTAYNSGTPESFPSPAPSPFAFSAPAGAGTLASLFNGANPHGTWQLFAVDDAAGATGVIQNGWCLAFTTTSDPATLTTLESSKPQAFTGESITFTATVRNAATSQPVTTGAVTFTDGNGNTLAAGVALNASGQASFSTSALTEGLTTLNANFSATAGFNSSHGTLSQLVDAPTTRSGLTFCNNGGVTLPAPGTLQGPARPYASRLHVSGLTGTLTGLTLTLSDLSHHAPADLKTLLVGPSGLSTQALDLLSGAGANLAVSGLNLTLADNAPTLAPVGSVLSSGSYRPTSTNAALLWPAPAPAAPYLFAAPAGSSSLSSVFAGSDPNGVWSLYLQQAGADANGGSLANWCLTFALAPPDLALARTHSGSFAQAQLGATYTLAVTNLGPSPATNFTVTDLLPAAFTLMSLAGDPWQCNTGTASCLYPQTLAAGQTSAPITATVNVAANAPASVSATATVSGAGDPNPNNNTATDTFLIDAAPDLVVAKAASGVLAPGQPASYLLTVSNTGGAATFGTVSLLEQPSTGVTVTALSGPGWSCTLGPPTRCQRSDALAAGQSYPPVTVSASLAAGPSAVNNARVNGGGELNTSNNTASLAYTFPLPTLSGNITAKSGPANARLWTLQLANAGPGSAAATSVTAFALTQTAGAACTPVLLTPLPAAAGTLAPGTSANLNLTLDFSSCPATAKFTATATLSANAGSATASVVRYNQYR